MYGLVYVALLRAVCTHVRLVLQVSVEWGILASMGHGWRPWPQHRSGVVIKSPKAARSTVLIVEVAVVELLMAMVIVAIRVPRKYTVLGLTK